MISTKWQFSITEDELYTYVRDLSLFGCNKADCCCDSKKSIISSYEKSQIDMIINLTNAVDKKHFVHLKCLLVKDFVIILGCLGFAIAIGVFVWLKSN
ncbi:hypothetical protein OENI_10219 [Oenococcus oeni]|nr:hypothetical protein OENI_10219 [Oenococcus oeni]